MILRAIALLLAFLGSAYAQNGPVVQSGTVTPGHATYWVDQGVVGDAGTAAEGFISSFGVTASGPALCQNSGDTSGPFNQICLGVTQTGGGQLSLTNYGGATGALSLTYNGTPVGIQINSTNCVVGSSCTITTTAGQITVNSTLVSGGSAGNFLYTDGTKLQARGTTGTAGSAVLSISPTLTGTPALGAPTAASLALGGATISSNALAVTGTSALAGNATLSSGNLTISTGNLVLGSTTENFPASGNIVGTTDTQSLTNKSIAGSEINSGTVGLTYGGTAANLTANAGGVVYSASSALAILNNPNSNGECLLSGTSAPTWGSCAGGTVVASVGNASADTSLTFTGTGSGPYTGAVTGKINLSNANTWAGVQTFGNGDLSLAGSSSGNTLLEATAAAGSGTVATFPANTGTVAELNLAQTWTAAQTFTNGDLLLKGSSSGAMTLEAPAVASTYIVTFPAATDTVSVLGTAQTFTAAKTFTNSDLLLLGSSTGATTFTSANSSGTNYTITVPAATDTLDLLGTAQTFTAAKTFTNSDLLLLGSSTGATTFTSANAGASNYTITFQAATDTVVGRATTDTLTNKTYNANGTGNVLQVTGSDSSSHQITALSGNTGTAATSNGALTNGHCVSIDANGNFVDAGGSCTTGGGGGTVNSGTTGELTYYGSTGTAVSGNANATISSGALTLGQSGSVLGQLLLSGSTSGKVTLTAQAISGTQTLTIPNTSGAAATFAVSASSPLVVNSTTGNLTITGGTGQVLAGSAPAFTATPTLGASGTIGTLTFGNSTSGLVTLGTVGGALGAVTASLPANTGTIAETNYAQTWSAAQTHNSGNLILAGASSGTTILNAAATAGTTTATLPNNTGTIAELNFAQTWTAVQTITNGDFALLGSSTGYTTLNSGLSSTGNNTLTLPITSNDTLAAIGTAQTWTAVQTFTNSDVRLLGSSTGYTTFTSANASGTNYVLTFPAVTSTAAVLGLAQTWTALQSITNGDLALLGSSTGYTLLESGLSSTGNNTLTLPTTSSDTLAALGTAETWTAVQTFTNSDIRLLGSSTGYTTFTSGNASGTNYTATFPANTGTVAELNLAQTFSAAQTFNASGNSIILGTVSVNSGQAGFIGSTSGSFAIQASSTGTPIITGVPSSTSAVAYMCYNSGTGAITYDSAGTCLVSSLRFKHDIEPLANNLDFVMRADPISFVFNDQASLKGRQEGLSAESLAAADPLAVEYDDEGKPLKPRMMALIAHLYGAIQEQQREIASLRAR